MERYKDQIKIIELNLEAIDRAIKVFDPDFDLRTIKAKGIHSLNQSVFRLRLIIDFTNGSVEVD